MNFFDLRYQEPPTCDAFFGICDDQNGQKAYTDRANRDKWIAIVKNDKPFQLIFTAIDKGVLQDTDLPGRDRCEGMLTSSEHIYFIELKAQKTGGNVKAKAQLASTISIFNDVHPGQLVKFKHKKAFICNRKHPKFQVIEAEEKIRFFQDYKFRLDVNTEIIFNS